MIRLIILFLAASSLLAQPIDIDADRLVPFVITTGGNTTGSTLGVQGGIEHRVDGGPSARPFAQNAVTDHSADRTGATDATTAIQAAINALSANQSAKLPVGVYKVGGPLYITQNFTSLVGDGEYELSSTTLTLGTGTKTLTVSSAVGWPAGVGVRIWRHLRPVTYMQGTVTSYTGSTMVLEVSEVGSQVYPGGAENPDYYDEIGESFNDWKVSLTYIDYENESAPAINLGNGSDYIWNAGNVAGTLAADASRGDTALTFVNASSFSTGTILRLSIRNLNTGADMLAATTTRVPAWEMPGYDYSRIQIVRVTGKTGNTVDVWPPLVFDMTSDLNPRVHTYSFFRDGVSVENLAIGGQGLTSNPWGLVNAFQCVNSWIYRVDAHCTPNRQMMIGDVLFFEVRKSWAWWRNGSGTNGAGILLGYVPTGLLIEDNVIGGTFPAIQANGSTTASAIIANYTAEGPRSLVGAANIATNHGGHNSFILVEHNISASIQSDGYHATEGPTLWYRNRLGLRMTGYLIASRGTWFPTMLGNVLGKDNTYAGAISYGNPSFSGVHNGGDPRHQTTIGGPFYRELEPGIFFTVATVTGSEITGTVNTGLEAPAALYVGLSPIRIYYPNSHPDTVTTKITYGLEITGISGGTVTLSRGSDYLGAPSPGDSYRVWLGPNGMQERDFTTEDTADQRHNYLYVGSGTPGGAITSAIPSGRYLPPSLTNRTTKPAYFGTYAWPPFDPEAPSGEENLIPAAGRALRADAPAPGVPPIAASGLTATAVSSSQINLAWNDNSDNESGFRIERRIGVGSWGTVTSVSAGSISYNNTGLSPSTTYEYRIYAYNGAGDSAASNTDSATTQSGGGPSDSNININGNLTIQKLIIQ